MADRTAETVAHNSASIRLVLAEDHYLMREGLRQALATDPSMEVVGVAEDRDSLWQLIEEVHPEVVVTDVRLPPTRQNEGVEIAVRLRQRYPSTGVVLVSQYAEPEYALRLLEEGSNGRAYLLKDRVASSANMVSAVREVARGGAVIDPKVVEKIVAVMEGSTANKLATLSVRETDVLSALADGKSNAAIAAALHLSEGAVEKHINSIFAKLDLPPARLVSRRVMAALLFMSNAQSDRQPLTKSASSHERLPRQR